ncbi:hypothetical protein Anas_10701 [Armadillidium nasatum]|uniref:Uncharacterized protein n=1 Tax=Armadillidium nasatum TaxID=96803 RepID=A0A5N5T267_9CRUS|nr:hypothetical protein Anas_10701 [Armadillidium nasatum]
MRGYEFPRHYIRSVKHAISRRQRYVQYSTIAARLVRQALKSDIRADAMKRDGVQGLQMSKCS